MDYQPEGSPTPAAGGRQPGRRDHVHRYSVFAISELGQLGTGTCGAVRTLGDARLCVLESTHTIHQDLGGDRRTVKESFLLQLPTQRPA